MRRYEALSEPDRRYVVQWLCAALTMPFDGYSSRHKDYEHAKWALDELENAINQKQPSVTGDSGKPFAQMETCENPISNNAVIIMYVLAFVGAFSIGGWVAKLFF